MIQQCQQETRSCVNVASLTGVEVYEEALS